MSGYDQQAVCDELGLEYFVNSVEYIYKIPQNYITEICTKDRLA